MATNDNERLIAWMRKKRGDMSYAQFAERTGVSKSTLQRFEAGESELSIASKVLLVQAFPDFPEWALSRDTAGQLATLGGMKHRVEDDRARWGENEYVELPLYDIAAATGPGKWNETERVKTYLQFRRDWLMWTCGTTAGLSLITAEGDSYRLRFVFLLPYCAAV